MALRCLLGDGGGGMRQVGPLFGSECICVNTSKGKTMKDSFISEGNIQD